MKREVCARTAVFRAQPWESRRLLRQVFGCQLAHFRGARPGAAEIWTEDRRAAADRRVEFGLARLPGACLAARLDVMDKIPAVPDELGIAGLLVERPLVLAHREQPQGRRAHSLPQDVARQARWFSEVQSPERLPVSRQ